MQRRRVILESSEPYEWPRLEFGRVSWLQPREEVSKTLSHGLTEMKIQSWESTDTKELLLTGQSSRGRAV